MPSTITYFGEEEKVQDWADAFVKIVCVMQEDYPSIIRGMVGYRFADIGKAVLTGIAGRGRFSKPVKLDNGLYLETDCSPDEIVSIVRVLMDKCNVDYDNIVIAYKKSERIDATAGEQLEGKAIVSEETPSTEGVRDYIVQALEKIRIPYVDHRNNNGCLWIVGDRSIGFVFDRFVQHGAVFHYKEDGGHATKGESAWWTRDVTAP